MVVRIWKGATRAEDAEAYAGYMNQTGVPGLAGTPGNVGVEMWCRLEGDRAEFAVVSRWESREAIVAFAGADIEVARFYPEDEQFLVERDLHVTHYDVVG